MNSVREVYGDAIYAFEVFFTIAFALEFVLRAASLRKPGDYIFSAMGIIDMASILPTFVSKCVAFQVRSSTCH